MGGSKSKQTTNQQQTSTVQLPAWMTEAGQGLYQDAKRTADANPILGYNGELAPGMSTNQSLASQAARATAGVGQGDLSAARALTMNAANPGNVPMVSANQPRTATMAPTMQTMAPTVRADQVSSANFTPDAAASYMSPYRQQVQDVTLAEMRRQNGIDRADLQDAIQGAGAYGGTRQALAESEQARNQATARDNYIAQSNQQAYDDAAARFAADRASRMQADLANQGANLQAGSTTASFLDQLLGRNQSAANTAGQFNAQQRNQTQGANADRALDASKVNASIGQTMLDRMLQGGGQLANIGQQASDMTGADIARLATTGQTEHDTTAAQDAANYNEFLRMQDAPMDRYRDLMAILSGTPRNVSTNGTVNGTTTTTQSGGLFNQLLGAAQVAAAFASDRRLKRDVTKLATSRSGLGIYAYRYLWDDEPRIGVMADEVEQIAPEALGPVIGGYRTVVYPALEGVL